MISCATPPPPSVSCDVYGLPAGGVPRTTVSMPLPMRAGDVEGRILRHRIFDEAARSAGDVPLGDDDAERAVALEAEGDVLVLEVLVEETRQQQRAGERAAEGVGGDGSEIEDLARRLDGVGRLRGEDPEVAAARHPLDQPIGRSV